MRKLLAAFTMALLLPISAVTLSSSPASADSVCHISSPQVNNYAFCGKATRTWTGNAWAVTFYLQNKGGTGTLSYCYGDVYFASTGTYYNGVVVAPYYASSDGVKVGSGLFVDTPTRVRVRCGGSSWSWSPWPPV